MMMPRMDGLTLAREIKAQADLPIIVLSAIDAGDSKADLLEEVAEDYVTKPYHYPELRARINRVLRRLGDKVPRQSLVLGPDLTLDLHRREATVGGQIVQLTPTESRLLYALAANLGQTVSTETLLARGWAETEDADPSYVWVTMRRLRQKVEVDPNRPVHVQTVRGVGYRLMPADETGAATVGGSARRRPLRDRRRGRPVPVVGTERTPRMGFRSRLTLALILAAVVPLVGFVVVLVVGRRSAARPTPPSAGSCCSRSSSSWPSRSCRPCPGGRAARPSDRSPRPSTASRPATCRRRSTCPVTTSSRAWPRATTAWPPTSPATQPRARPHPRRDRRGLAPRRRRGPRRPNGAPTPTSAFALIDATVVLGDPSSVDEEEVVPGVSRPLRAVLRAGGDATSACSSAGCPRRDAGSGPTRTCSSCSRARWPPRSATPSSSPPSRTRTSSCSSSTRPRTTSCAASATTSRRR